VVLRCAFPSIKYFYFEKNSDTIRAVQRTLQSLLHKRKFASFRQKPLITQ